jgi:nicastrin
MVSLFLGSVNFQTMLELDQLGAIGLNDNNKLYIHNDPISYSKNKTISNLIDEFSKKLSAYSNDFITSTDTSKQLPPASIQSLLKHNINIAGLLLSDFDATTGFKNNFYHSIFDTAKNLNISFPDNITEADAVNNYSTKLGEQIQKSIVAMTKTLYFMATKEELVINSNDLEKSQTTVNNLIYCFYKNVTCDLFKQAQTDYSWSVYLQLLDNYLPKGKLSFYTSVNGAAISGK